MYDLKVWIIFLNHKTISLWWYCYLVFNIYSSIMQDYMCSLSIATFFIILQNFKEKMLCICTHALLSPNPNSHPIFILGLSQFKHLY